MTTTRWMITSLLALTAPLGLLGCDADDGDAGDEAAEGDESTGDESTGGEGDETLGRTEADESEGDETLGRTDINLEDDGPMDFGEGDTDAPSGCAANQSEAECDAEPGCSSVFGNAILPDGDGWCSAPESEYIGCVSSGNLCPPIQQTLCDGEQMWTSNDCVPDTLMICESPGDISDICA